jgi:hypothetical protein
MKLHRIIIRPSFYLSFDDEEVDALLKAISHRDEHAEIRQSILSIKEITEKFPGTPTPCTRAEVSMFSSLLDVASWKTEKIARFHEALSNLLEAHPIETF